MGKSNLNNFLAAYFRENITQKLMDSFQVVPAIQVRYQYRIFSKRYAQAG